MSRNIEIKARVRDAVAFQQIASKLATAPVETLVQCDVFFNASAGRLKLRITEGVSAQLIAYRRADAAGPRTSEYQICEVADAHSLRTALAMSLGERGEVRKQRKLFMHGRTRIHLDDVASLGSFAELEVVLGADEDEAAAYEEAATLMQQLDIAQSDLESSAYIDLLGAARPAV